MLFEIYLLARVPLCNFKGMFMDARDVSEMSPWDAIRLSVPAMMINLIALMIDRIHQSKDNEFLDDLNDKEIQAVSFHIIQLYQQLNGLKFTPNPLNQIPLAHDLWAWCLKNKMKNQQKPSE